MLDRDLRLISVVEPEAHDPSDPEPEAHLKRAGEPSYQLAHDYLVESIRRWVAGKERATRAGRAWTRLVHHGRVLRRAARAAAAPSLTEWLSILTATRPDRWSASERKMMGAATRLHLGRATLSGASPPGPGSRSARTESRNGRTT